MNEVSGFKERLKKDLLNNRYFPDLFQINPILLNLFYE